MAIQTVGVVGAGVIGASWTALFLSKGLKVLVSDPGKDVERQLQAHLEEMWPTLEKLGLSEGADIKNCKFVGASLKEHGPELDFVQENGPERQDLKESIVAEIENVLRPGVVLASSSSGLPSSKFIGKCKSPERVLIGHPFNPPHLMPLVEVVPHPGSSEQAISSAMDFYKFLGKEPIHIRKEVPGFAANRLQATLCNEVYSLVNRGVCTAEDVDKCMTASLGPRWALTGPLMSNALGGGGGVAGFKHILEHIGPASKVWLDDMKAHEFDYSPESMDRLATSVGKMMEGHPVDQVVEARDRLTIDLLKGKANEKVLI